MNKSRLFIHALMFLFLIGIAYASVTVVMNTPPDGAQIRSTQGFIVNCTTNSTANTNVTVALYVNSTTRINLTNTTNASAVTLFPSILQGNYTYQVRAGCYNLSTDGNILGNDTANTTDINVAVNGVPVIDRVNKTPTGRYDTLTTNITITVQWKDLSVNNTVVDSVRVFLCANNSFNAGTGLCTGGSWCNTTTSEADNISSCGFIPKVFRLNYSGRYPVYAFAWDDNNTASTMSNTTFNISGAPSQLQGGTAGASASDGENVERLQALAAGGGPQAGGMGRNTLVWIVLIIVGVYIYFEQKKR